MIRSVAALVGGKVAAFELGIVCQVFGLDRSDDGLPTYDFAVCTQAPGAVPSTSGFDVQVTHGLDRLAHADLITVPAWPELDEPVPAPVVSALRDAVERGAQLLAICTGAFLPATAGLLDGRRATTHWQFTDRLRGRYPSVQVVNDVLYVEDGAIVTSAGAAAGVDACLHVVRAEHGAAVANALARRMVVPAHRAGGQHQYVEMPVPTPDVGYELSELMDWMLAHLDQPLTVPELAARALMSPRTFARRFTARTGTTPHRWLLDQRLRLAEQLLETTGATVDTIAVRTGFGSTDALRHHFHARRGVSPVSYRRAFEQDRGAVSPPG